MFEPKYGGPSKFNQPFNDWNISKETILTDMFKNCKTMEQKNKPKRVIEAEEKARAEEEERTAKARAEAEAGPVDLGDARELQQKEQKPTV